MAIEISKKSIRDELEVRHEPYWGPMLDVGRYVGVRKVTADTYIWTARLRDEEGKQHYKSLGALTKTFDYPQGKKKAEEWFANFDIGVTDTEPTVADACRAYVAQLEADGRGAKAKGDRRKDPAGEPGSGAAHDAEKRFQRLVYDAPIGKVRLDKVRTTKLKEWRNAIEGTKASQNRNWEALRAALYLAVADRRVNPALREELRGVKKHKNAKKRRELYLDLEQRRALLEHCFGAVRDLIEAAALTGARPGELVALRVGDFDARTKTLSIKTGKTGRRAMPVSDAAAALFKRCSKDKLPAAQLLPADDGKPWPHSGWDEGVKSAAQTAKLPAGVVLYTLRHSWITEALLAGMPTLEVARLTGTSLQMIEENYGHLAMSSARERLKSVQML